MKTTYRFEIYPNQYQPTEMSLSENKLTEWFTKYCNIKFDKLFKANYFLLESNEPIPEIDTYAKTILTDSVTEVLFSSESKNLDMISYLGKRGFSNPVLCDISFKPGVTDNSAHAVLEAFKLIPDLKKYELNVASGECYFMQATADLADADYEKFTYEKLANQLLQKVTIQRKDAIQTNARMQAPKIVEVIATSLEATTIDLNQDEQSLLKLNTDNCWALSLEEIYFVRDYFKTLDCNPTDVEMEVIAQSWSEHCKHKIFASHIEYSEGELPSHMRKLGHFEVNSLFKTFIRGATEKIKADRNLPWLVSIFHDNAGIVRFDKNVDVCIKVETHNSPSALDPYGGALTGILGVNRDILGCGQGAKPIANTNVFCLAEDSFFKENNIKLHSKLKNPDRIAEGVHLGVQDGGNKSGIPTVNGAFVYDHDFVGKPLVFCGTVGVLPQTEHNQSTAEKRQKAGDYIVMSGGKIGKDGIHGATFSSMELNENAPASVVQIGDPITQKRLGDFLIEARRLDLFSSVTDNGAGGLSSSVGEMATYTNGAIVELDRAPTKYPGLSPFELMVSESQERMTFAVPKEKIHQFLQLSEKRNVLSTVIGEFTNQGQLLVRYQGKTVADLNLHFLHESLKPMQLKAHIDTSSIEASKASHWLKGKIKEAAKPASVKEQLLSLLSSANIRSHEHLVRRYDHEVKAATLVKPFTGTKEIGRHAPTDAGVIWLYPHGGEQDNAISISCGIAPQVSQYDAYEMAIHALDEAVRNSVCVGADPTEMVLVDNYCWPDPITSKKNPDGAHKLAQLVRTSKAIYDLSTDYGMPFVSGKDSMKNDFMADDVKISVQPTLLVTAMGRVRSLSHITTSEAKASGDLVYLMGPDQLTDFKKQLELYKSLHKAITLGFVKSAHDVSEGGLAVSLTEKIMATTLGMQIDTTLDLFKESAGRIVVTTEKAKQKEFEALFTSDLTFLGTVTASAQLEIKNKLIVTNAESLNAYRIKAKGDVVPQARQGVN
ncbi:phosphoribosylformylglycinamidine synthase subunit PurL [Pseudobdellovibrio sp. HCB154]|uniref:phosphoribosylformylglycinamidine synthase subunit PurL n=1 Tax=Pseudobdellovibrio sp. HCB154 TaxID=3386277 RepID=UPI003916E6B2